MSMQGVVLAEDEQSDWLGEVEEEELVAKEEEEPQVSWIGKVVPAIEIRYVLNQRDKTNITIS